jgi:outer membrane protein
MYKRGGLPVVVITLMAVSTIVSADSLKELLKYATHHNNIVISKTLEHKSQLKEVESARSSYFPTFDIGATYKRLDERSPYSPGDIYTGYAQVGFAIYDGSKRSNLIKQQSATARSLQYTTSAYKKNLQLSVVEAFFQIKTLEAELTALNEADKQLAAELRREKKFFQVGSVTKDNVESLQAAYSNNHYQISDLKYQIESAKEQLTLLVGKKITDMSDATIVPPSTLKFEVNDSIKSLQSSSKALVYQANGKESVYMPNINLTDTYSINGYGRYDATHPKGQTNQNILLLSLNLRLFDYGEMRKQKEAIMLQKMALEHQIDQDMQTQNIHVRLAFSKIKMIKTQIQSAQSALKSAQSAFETISQKYEVGSVDHVTYLNALTVKTNALWQYQTALNNLQVAYAAYYFYTNNNIQEYVK